MRKKLLRVLGVIIAMLLAADIAGIFLLEQYYFVRYIPVKSLQDVYVSQTSYDQDRSKLYPIYTADRAVLLLEQTMNRVKKVEPTPAGGIKAIMRRVNSGGGVECGGMALFYHHELYQHDIQARIIQLMRGIGNNDTHVVVEVNLNNKWVIFDPTFNVSYEKGGVLIGAQEIHQSLLDGTFSRVKPIFYGEVAYPSRLEHNYMHWLSYYNNVFVTAAPKSVWLSRIFQLKYWYGAHTYYPEEGVDHDSHLQRHNKNYFIFVVILPLIITGLALIFATKMIFEYRHKKK